MRCLDADVPRLRGPAELVAIEPLQLVLLALPLNESLEQRKGGEERARLILDLDRQGMPRAQIAKAVGINRATLYRFLDRREAAG